MRPLRESLAGERIRRVMGIVNGTTNYILTRMTEEGSSFADALAEAQRLGYAERDPTADVEGFDAAAKAAIIASIAFGARVVAGDVYREGITNITADDIAAARRARLRRQAARGRRGGRRRASAHACTPRWSRSTIRSRSVRGSYNAVFIEGEAVGQLMLLGRGAGGGPTASAVLGDLIDAAKNLRSGARGATIGTLHKHADPPDRRDRPRSSTSRSTPPTGPVCSPRSPACSATTRSRSSRCSRRVRATRRRLIFVTHLRARAAMAATIHEVRELDVGRARRLGAARRRRRGVSRGAPYVARDHRGVPRPAAGHRQDARRHAARGQHAARRRAAALASRSARAST